MPNELNDYLKLLNETAVITENEDKIRTLCSDIIACAKNEKDEKAVLMCRKKLRALQNEKCISKNERDDFVCTDFGQMCESLFTAAGILLTDAGKSLSFTGKPLFVYCNAETIIDAVLNLISNAAKFSSSAQITAAVVSVGSQAVLKIENSVSGNCSPSFNNGLWAVSHAAQTCGGRFVLSSSKRKIRAALALPQQKEHKNVYRTPPFSSLLENTFSPVYIGLSDVLLPQPL